MALGCWPINAAQAQQPASPFAPVATPTLGPDALKIPLTPPHTDVNRFKPDGSAKAGTEWAIPKTIDLGSSKLDFDAKHTFEVTKPGVGVDSGELSNLSRVAPGRRQEPALPDYFGLKLRIPTN